MSTGVCTALVHSSQEERRLGPLTLHEIILPETISTVQPEV